MNTETADLLGDLVGEVHEPEEAVIDAAALEPDSEETPPEEPEAPSGRQTEYHVFATGGSAPVQVWFGAAASRAQAVKLAMEFGQPDPDPDHASFSCDLWDYLWVVPASAMKGYEMRSVRVPVAVD